MTQTLTPVAMAPALELPPAAVIDVEAARAMADVENQGHNILAEKGLTALGGTYISYEGQNGTVIATVRETMTVCPHLGKLPDAVLGVVIESSMKVEPTPQEINPNLVLPSA